jgi:NAD(P)-dependent dehydrogenase (short-subunit alcohol dehydrogenase family)
MIRPLATSGEPARLDGTVGVITGGGRGIGKVLAQALAARLVTRLATGEADRLSGCHLSVHDDLDAILACGPDIRDRYQLRLASHRPVRSQQSTRLEASLSRAD